MIVHKPIQQCHTGIFSSKAKGVYAPFKCRPILNFNE